MLQRRTHSSGVVYYASPLLEQIGVPHAFSTRIGGISTAPFDSMNLGNPNGCAIQDDTDHIARNYDLLQTAINCGNRERCWVHQIHGPDVLIAKRNQPFTIGAKADAVVSDDPARVAAVRIADCVPVLLASRDGTIVAAAHAGWRGVITGVATASLKVMLDLRPDLHAKDFIVAIGPSISFEAFEVGPEVLAEFVRVFEADAPIQTADNGKGFVDLRQAIKLQLLAAGVPENQIDPTDRCTVHNRDEFFSHRRDNGITGRMAALIGCK